MDAVDVLLGVNALVFAGWWLAPPQFMNDNFVCSLRNWREGRWWTLITPAFSHQTTTHFLINSSSLRSVGKAILPEFGAWRTLLLYLAAGVTSCLCHLVYANEIRPRIMASTPSQLQLYKTAGAEKGMLGMSGSVKAITILFAAFFPSAVLILFEVLRLQAPVAVGAVIAADLLMALYVPESGISHAGHLGGALCGLLCALSMPRRFGRR